MEKPRGVEIVIKYPVNKVIFVRAHLEKLDSTKQFELETMLSEIFNCDFSMESQANGGLQEFCFIPESIASLQLMKDYQDLCMRLMSFFEIANKNVTLAFRIENLNINLFVRKKSQKREF